MFDLPHPINPSGYRERNLIAGRLKERHQRGHTAERMEKVLLQWPRCTVVLRRPRYYFLSRVLKLVQKGLLVSTSIFQGLEVRVDGSIFHCLLRPTLCQIAITQIKYALLISSLA